jgi:hypothetical protein
MNDAMVLMGIEITEDMIQMLQLYLGYVAEYLHIGMTAGTWILLAGTVVAAVALLSQEKHIRKFFRKKRIKR